MSGDEQLIDPFAGVEVKDFYRLDIYGSRGDHIVSLRLKKEVGHTIGDMAQLQNYLWTQLGLAIREDKDLQHRLSLGGIEVLLEDPNESAPVSDAG